MDREITVTLTPRVLRWAVFYQLRSLIILFTLILLALIGNLVFLTPHGGDLSSTAYTLPIIMFLFIFFVFYTAYARSMGMVRKLGTPEMKYRITDEWLYVESDLSSGKNSWTIFKSLQKNAKLWLVVIHSGAAFVFPAELLDEELKTFLSSKLPSKRLDYLSNAFKILAVWLLVVFLVMYWIRRV